MEKTDSDLNTNTGLPAEVSAQGALLRIDAKIKEAEQRTREIAEGIGKRFPEAHPDYIDPAVGE